ncbi:MAG: type II toxin-antitoxin system VapC family toxin [Rhizomicrobium sp.]
MAEIVIDASSAVCFLRCERGWENFFEYLPGSIMSVVNYAEVVQRLLRDDPVAELRASGLVGSGLKLVDLDLDTALAAARLEGSTRSQGVSLADRVCLALAMGRKLPVLTADKPWTELSLPVDIKLLR